MELKLLIVEDAPFIREAIRSLALASGINVIGEASDGIEAVKLAREKKPDVILMDMVLPKKNGIEATKEILSENESIRVIACSTEGQEELLMQAVDAGCCNFIAKPFRSEELINIIKSAMNLEKREGRWSPSAL